MEQRSQLQQQNISDELELKTKQGVFDKEDEVDVQIKEEPELLIDEINNSCKETWKSSKRIKIDTPHKRERVRKMQQQWTTKQTEKLIKEVKMRKGTWNCFTKEYWDRNLREAHWKMISTAMRMPRMEVSSKWNSIRSSFRTHFNKVKYGEKTRIATTPEYYKALKFLEPTLRSDASTRSKLSRHFRLSESQSEDERELEEEKDDIEIEDEEEDYKSKVVRLTPSSLKRRHTESNTEYSKTEEHSLEIMNSTLKSDIWTDIGNFVAANGREWAAKDPKLANDYKTAIYKVVLSFQEVPFKQSDV